MLFKIGVQAYRGSPDRHLLGLFYTGAMATSDLSHQPFISICIPTYRRTTYIRQSLGSSLNQHYDNYEILVNDDTQDNSIKSIVQSFDSEKIRYFQNIPLIGMMPKFNAFLNLAKGEWMLILCDDDYLEPDYLQQLAMHIQNYPRATLVRSRYRLVDAEGKTLRLDNLYPFCTEPSQFLKDIFLPENKAPFKMNGSGILFQKERLKKVGGFQYFYRGWHNDRLAWAELGAQGQSICEPTPLCNIRLHGGSLTAAIDPDYVSAIDTDLRMKELSEKMIEDASKNYQTPKDRDNLLAARKNLHDYINRHLSKSFDHGFLTTLEGKTGNKSEEISALVKYMRDLKVPVFRSVILYRILARLPHAFRVKILDGVRKFKIKKWN